VDSVIEALEGVAPEEELATALLGVAQSPDIDVEARNGAAARLGELGLPLPEDALDKLVVTLLDPTSSDSDKEIAALALRRSVDEEGVRTALAATVTFSADGPHGASRAAAEALVSTLDPEVLMGWLETDRPELRAAVVAGIDQARPEELARMPAEARKEIAQLIASSDRDGFRLRHLRAVAALDPDSVTERTLALDMVTCGDVAGASHLFVGDVDEGWVATVADAILESSPRPQAMAEALQALAPEHRAVLVVKGHDALRTSSAELEYRRTLEAAAAKNDQAAMVRLHEIGIGAGDRVRRKAVQSANLLAVVEGRDAQYAIVSAAGVCSDYEVGAEMLGSLQSVATADVLGDLRHIADLHGHVAPEGPMPATPEARFGAAAADLFRDITERRTLDRISSLDPDALRAIVRGAPLEGADDPEHTRVERAARELVRRGDDPDEVAKIVFQPADGEQVPIAARPYRLTEHRVDVAAAIGARSTLDAIAAEPDTFEPDAVRAVSLSTRAKCQEALDDLRPSDPELDRAGSGRRPSAVEPLGDELGDASSAFDVEGPGDVPGSVERFDDDGAGRGLEFP